ncbi:MAG: glycosyltransferase family 2 protein [Phycisphaerae bacterium]|nr:glycosyltransferase family 2 protein [Phycisphaerae bacterium]
MDLGMLSYEIVIATRNRPDALALSVPRLLTQTHPPARIVIVDSSDEHQKVAEVVDPIAARAAIPIDLIHGPRGASVQRNVGLERVTAPVVIFPDDDSIFAPNAAEEILRVYTLDTAGTIGGVCAAPTVVWPDADVPPGRATIAADGRSTRERIRTLLEGPRTKLERLAFPNPFVTLGQSFWPSWTFPEWFSQFDVVPVEWMTGFRMSFRTDAIRRVRFDERLRNYSLFEDADASFAVMQGTMVVGARLARIYHDKAPGERGDPRTMGVIQLLNRSYVVCKNSPPGHPARRQLVRHSRYKVWQYRMGARNDAARARHLGAKATLDAVREFAVAPSANAGTIYEAWLPKLLPPRPAAPA